LKILPGGPGGPAGPVNHLKSKNKLKYSMMKEKISTNLVGLEVLNMIDKFTLN
jgi:hypothetical protein